MKNKGEKSHKQKIWKIVSIAVIILFSFIIIGGLIKAYYFKASFVKPTQEQIDYATKIADDRLKSMHVNSSMFQVHADRMRRIHDEEEGKIRGMMQVSFYNNSTMHTFLVDVYSGEILLHSETDAYGSWMNHKQYSYHNFMPFMMHKKSPMWHGESNERKY